MRKISLGSIIAIMVGYMLFVAAFAGPSDVQRQGEPFNNFLIDANPGFENGLTRWSSSGGSFTKNTTLSNVGRGVASGAWDASSTGQTLTSAQRTVPAGNYGNDCIASALVKGGDNTLTFRVIDGSLSTLGSAFSFPSAYTSFTKISVAFSCPTSGTVAVRFETTSNAPVVYIDEVSIGKREVIDNVGVTDGSNAIAGFVGEYVEDVHITDVALTAAQYTDVASISLTAGDWDITLSGQVSNSGAAAYIVSGISTTSGNTGTGLDIGDNSFEIQAPAGISGVSTGGFSIHWRRSISSTTTFYGKVNPTASGVANFRGKIFARRIR